MTSCGRLSVPQNCHYSISLCKFHSSYLWHDRSPNPIYAIHLFPSLSVSLITPGLTKVPDVIYARSFLRTECMFSRRQRKKKVKAWEEIETNNRKLGNTQVWDGHWILHKRLTDSEAPTAKQTTSIVDSARYCGRSRTRNFCIRRSPVKSRERERRRFCSMQGKGRNIKCNGKVDPDSPKYQQQDLSHKRLPLRQ